MWALKEKSAIAKDCKTVQRLYFAVSSWSSSTASLQCPGVFAATTNVRKTIALMLRKEIYLRAVTCLGMDSGKTTNSDAMITR